MDVSNFTAYERITIDHTKVYGSSNHSNFPILVDITITALKHTSNGGYVDSTSGDDIVFIDYDGTTQLDHEIQSYNSETGNIIAWVRIPTLDTTADTEIFIYFGDSNITTPQENPSGTWIENFVLIHHMDDVSGTITDSLGSHNSNSQTGMTYQQTGKINKSIYFDEVDDHYTISDFNYGDTFTISLWFKEPDAVGSLLQYIFSHGVTGNNPSTFIRTMESGHTYANRLYASAYDDVSSIEEVYSLAEEINVNDGNWHLFQFIRVKNGTTKLVVDGGLRDSYSSPNTSVSPSTPIYIGGRQDLDVDRFFGGYLEELHIASVERTIEWCATEYANQNSPSTFYTISGNYMSSTSSTTSSSTASLNVDSVGKIINLVVDHTKVFGTGDHSNFPALVSITRDYLRSVSQGGEVYYDNGTDIVFLSDPDDSTSYLDFEIQQYDCTTGLLIAWVRVPSLDTTANTTIYLSFGDSSISTSQENINGVWISNFEGVWHLKESGNGTSNEFIDSSGGNKHGTGGNGSASATPTRTEGKIGYCQSFDGNDFITMGDVFDYGKSTQHSYSAWVRTSNSSAMQIIGKASHSTWQGIWCDFEAGGDLSFFIYDSGGNYKSKTCNTNFTDNNWHYIMTTYNGNNDVSGINIYADGSLITPASSNNDNLTGAVVNDFPFNVGAANNSGYFWNGLISEPRFRHYETTLEWYQTEYANQNSPSTFYTFEIPLYCAQEVTTSASAALTLGVVEPLDSTCSITTSISSTIILGLVEVLSTINIVVSDTTCELILGSDESLNSGCYVLSDSTAEITLGTSESLSSTCNITSDSTADLTIGQIEVLSSTCNITSDSTASTITFGQSEPLSSTSNSTTSVDSALILGLVEVLSTINIVVSDTTSELILGSDEALNSGCYSLSDATCTLTLGTSESLSSTINIYSDATAVIEGDYITAYPWQTKIVYDDTYIWKATYDETLKAIIFEYSTSERLSIDPNDWTENINARITDADVSADFSIHADNTYLFIAYSTYEDIYCREATGYPGTNFSWDNPVLTYDGSVDSGRYSFPNITRDGANYRVNVISTLYKTGTQQYSLNIKIGTAVNRLPGTSQANKILITDQSLPIISAIRRGPNSTTGSIIAVWKRGTNIESAYRNGTDNNPVGGDDWETTQSIATGLTGTNRAFDITINSLTGDTELVYINSSGFIYHRSRPAGSGQSWSNEEALCAFSHNYYPVIGEHQQNGFHVLWYDYDTNQVQHREYNSALNEWYPSIDPLETPELKATVDNLSWLNISSNTGSVIAIYQVGFNDYTLYIKDNEIPLAPTDLRCEGQINPVDVHDTTPEFTAIYNSNGDDDLAYAYQIELRREGELFTYPLMASGLDSTAGIETSVTGLQTGLIELWSINGTVGGSQASYLGKLENGVYTDGDTLDSSSSLYLSLNNGAYCSYGDTLTLNFEDGSSLSIYLPTINAGEHIILFLTNDGTTWKCSSYCIIGCVNPDSIGLMSGSLFDTPISDGTACEEVNLINELDLDGTTYYWKIRFRDESYAWSPWSDSTSYFTMHVGFDSTCNITTDSTAELSLGTSEILLSTCEVYTDSTSFTIALQIDSTSHCYIISNSTAGLTLGEIVYLSSTCDIYSDATAELTLGTIESLDSTCNITTSTTSVMILGLVEVLLSVNVIVSDTTCELILGTDETLNSGCYIDSTCFAELTLGTETTLSSICNITSDSTATTLTLGRIEQLSVINCYIYSDTTSELTLGTSESLSSTCIITTDSTSFTIALEIDSTSCCTIASSSVAGELVLGLVEVLSTDNIVVSDCTCELILGTDEQLDSTCNISTYVEANLFLGIPLTSTSTITTDSTAEITLGRSESLFGSSDSETNMYGWLYFGVGEDLRGDSQALSSASALLTLGVTEEISSTCSIINSSSSTLVLGLSEVLTSTCNITTDSTASLSFTGELIDLTSSIDIYSDSTAIFTLDNLSISGSTNVLSDATAIITLGELTSLSSTININSDTTAILYNAIELDSTATIQSIVSSRMEVNVILISSHFCDSTSEVNAELSVIKSISSTANISSSLSGYIVFGTFELLSSDSHTYSNVGPSPLLIGYIVLSSISYVTSDSTAELTIGTSESLSSSSDITSDSTALLYISGSPISLDSTSYIDSTSIASLVITRGLDSTAIIVSDSTATTFILNPLAIDSTSITTSDVTGGFSNIVALDSTSSVMSDSTSDLTSGAGEGITGTSSTTSDTTGVINLIPLALNGTPGVNSNVQAVISLVTSVSGTTSLITSTLAKLYIGNIENIDSTCIIVTNSIAELTLGTIESLSSTCFIDSTAYSETLTISGSELGLDSTCIISTTVLASLSTGEFVSLDSTCIIDTTSYSTITLGKTELISLTCYVYSDAAAELTIGTSESLSGSSDSTSYVISELTIGGYTEFLDSTCSIITDISGTLTLGDIVSLLSTCDVSTDATCEISLGTSESLSSIISVDSTCYASLTIGIHSTCNITTDSTSYLTLGTIENLEATTNLISIAVAGTLILGIPVDLHSTSYIISDATCELSFGTQEYLNSSVNVTSDSTSYLTLGTIEELFGQSNITSDSTASILNVGTIEELTSTSNIDSTCIATISLGQLESIYSTIIIDSTATASITMGAITELSSNVVIQSDSTSSTLITGQPESLTSLINIDSTCYAELTLGTIESLSSSISYTSNTSTPSLVFGIIEVLSSTSYSIVDGTCILAVEMVIDSTCDILSSVISELTIGHIESISSTCNITSDSTAELTLGTITQLTSTCSITSNVNGSIYIGEITTLDSTCIIVSNVACGRYFNVYKSKEFKSKIATLEVEFWFGQFIVNREANITPVDFTEVTFAEGENTGEKSFIEMLFNDDYSYTSYRYLYRELTDDREWPEAMRTRLNIYGKYNSYYVCDNDSSSVCNINLYDVTSDDREMLNRLLTYRVDPTTATLSGINYDDLQSPLACLIYLYLDLKINSSLQYYQEGILLSTSGYNLESFYEKYVLEEIFRFISSR